MKTDEEVVGNMNKNTDKSLILRGSKIISIEVSMNIIKSTDAGIKATYIYIYIYMDTQIQK